MLNHRTDHPLTQQPAIVGLLVLIATAMSHGGCAAEPSEGCTEEAPTVSISATVTEGTVKSDVAVRLEGSPACQFANTAMTASPEVALGGGTVAEKEVQIGGNGADVTWTLGPAPIRQELRLSKESGSITVVASVAAPVVPTPFADVHNWMKTNKLDSTTEDLAIRADGTMVLGIDAGLLELKTDATGKTIITHIEPTGDKLLRAHGIAYDRKGLLWIADPTTPALHAMTPAGVVTTHLKDNGTEPLLAPNYVGVAPADRVVVSDPCLGELILYDPASKKVLNTRAFDLKTEGGPNGFAFDGNNEWLYVVTMNTGLLCPSAKVKPHVTANIASLFRFKVQDAKFGERETIEVNFALFGDGMAFDKEGNLYVVLDTVKNVALQESRVMVLRKGEAKMVPFVAFKKDTLIANVAFGRGPLGETTMYGALIALAPFTGADRRGVVKFEVGVPGLGLLL